MITREDGVSDITIHIPEALLSRVTGIAERNGRTPSEEIIRMLRASYDREALLGEIRQHREEMGRKGVWPTDEFIDEAINEGMP